MGDAVMVRSIMEYLRTRHPDMTIGVMAGPSTREVMSLGSGFRVHEYDPARLGFGGAVRMLWELRRQEYEAILNFEQGSLAGTAFLALSGVPLRLGFKALDGVSKAGFLSHQVAFRPNDSMWQSFVRLARLVDPELPETLGITGLPLDAHVRNQVRTWLGQKLGLPRPPLIAMHLGAGQGQPFKRWPVYRFVELASRFAALRNDQPAILLTGQELERPLIAEFAARYHGRIADGGEFRSVSMTAAALAECELLVSNDTGIMHLGAAVGTPTVGLFGATEPACWAPRGPHATFVYDTKVACSPCVDSYRNRTPWACANPRGNVCMLDIPVASVIDAARQVIAGSWLD